MTAAKFTNRPRTSISAINWFFGKIDKISVYRPIPTAEELLVAAQRFTTTEHVADRNLVQRLSQFLECFEGEERLTFTGRLVIHGIALDALRRRLLLEREFEENPEVLGTAITKPLFIVGFPRSGTTFLQQLMSSHPGCRWIRTWEIGLENWPDRNIWGSPRDPRRENFNRAVRKHKKQYRDLDEIHALDSPAECWELFTPTFIAPQFFELLELPRYRDWSGQMAGDKQALRETYGFFKRSLQHLLWRQQGCHWVLKSPDHMANLDVLLEQFPDARIIQLHRHPRTCVPSMCSLTARDPRAPIRNSSPEEVGQNVLNSLQRLGVKNVNIRANLKETEIYDISFNQLTTEPLTTVRKIYDRFGIPWTEEVESNIKRFLDMQKERGKQPKHRYRSEDFGISPAEIDRKFAPYSEAFSDYLG